MKYYLFDFDGTLVETKEGIIKSARYALEKMGVDCALSDGELEVIFIGPPLTGTFPRFVGNDSQKVQAAIDHFRVYYRKTGVFENRLFENCKECLESLKRESKLYISSSKPEVFVRDILGQRKIADYFEEVYAPGLDEDKTTKYDVIMSAINKIKENDSAPRIYMVGDRKYDIEGAHKAGIKAIGVRWGSADTGELEDVGADYIVESFEALKELDKNL